MTAADLAERHSNTRRVLDPMPCTWTSSVLPDLQLAPPSAPRQQRDHNTTKGTLL